MELVRLTAADAGETLTVQRAAYVTEAQKHDDLRLPPLTQTLEDLRTELADPAVVALGLRERGRLIGTVRLRPWPDEPAVRELARLAVVPDRQGEGLGARLLAEAEAHGRRDNDVREL